jgi:hypothetical protein
MEMGAKVRQREEYVTRRAGRTGVPDSQEIRFVVRRRRRAGEPHGFNHLRRKFDRRSLWIHFQSCHGNTSGKIRMEIFMSNLILSDSLWDGYFSGANRRQTK